MTHHEGYSKTPTSVDTRNETPVDILDMGTLLES